GIPGVSLPPSAVAAIQRLPAGSHLADGRIRPSRQGTNNRWHLQISGTAGLRCTTISQTSTRKNMTDKNLQESLKVDSKLEKSFEEALSHKLTDEDIERARLLIGHDKPNKGRELYSTAHPDALRNWAYGAGDDNPLYTDEDYGPNTRWGSQIGHGTQVGHIKTPMLGDGIPDEVKK